MSRFAPSLRRLGARLSIPQPARGRVLLELAADMEDMRRHLMAQGLDENEATRRTEAEFALGDDALAELVAVHSSPLRRALDGVSARTRSRWERGLLIGVLLFLFAVSAPTVLSGGAVATAGPYVWPVLALAAVALLLILAKLVEFAQHRDPDPRRMRGRLAALPCLAATQLALGFVGAWLELGRLAMNYALPPGGAGAQLADWLLASAALLIIAHLCALLTAVAWFLLDVRVRRIETQEAALLEELLAAKP